MQILNSKAYYLKNYALRTRRKSLIKPTHSLTDHSTQQSNPSNNEILRIRNINRLPRIRADVRTCHSAGSHTTFVEKELYPINKDCQHIYQKQKLILCKLLKQQKQLKRKKKSATVNKDYAVIENHPLGDINSFEFGIMKPTDRYFHQMQNVRLAQRLLLAKPSSSISRISTEKFYKEQQRLKSNISRISKGEGEHPKVSKRKHRDRRKWID